MNAFVYVMAADNGEVKIGWSSTPYARLSKVKAEYGPRRGFRDVRLVGFVPTPCFMQVESDTLRRLEAWATGGEWFRLDPREALRVVVAEALSWESRVFLHQPRLEGRRWVSSPVAVRVRA